MAPTLVNLTLDQAVPRLRSHTIPPPPAHGPSIALPSLRTLRILCHANDCVHLMDHLSINPAATMDLTGNSVTDLAAERLVEIVSAHMSRSTPLLAGYKDADLERVDFDDLERPLAAALKGAVTENGTNTLEIIGNPGSGFVEALSDVHDLKLDNASWEIVVQRESDEDEDEDEDGDDDEDSYAHQNYHGWY
ncbi:hypothetical protein V8D89_013531 [Ganoderma adspersum]